MARKKAYFPRRLFLRLVFFQGLLVVLAFLIAGLIGRSYFRQVFVAQVQDQLKDNVAQFLRNDFTRPDACRAEAEGTRVRYTVFQVDGVVLCDSSVKPTQIVNPLDRPEVQAAILDGVGTSYRYSTTVQQSMIYAAVRVERAGLRYVVRAAYPVPRLLDLLRSHDIALSMALLAMAAVLGLYAYWAGRLIAFPLGRISVLARSLAQDTDDDIRRGSIGELEDLESSIHRMRRDLLVTTQSLRTQGEELGVLLSHISDAVLAVGLDQVPLFFNARFASIFRIPSGALHNRHLSEILRAPAVLEAVETSLKDACPCKVDIVGLSIHEALHYFSISVSPLRDADKKVYGALAIFHDVTSLKKSEQIRSDFVANVSHELRTPLTSIQGYIDTALEDLQAGRPVEPEHLVVAQRNADRLMQLISDLLDISALESGFDHLELSRVGTRAMTEQVFRQLDRKISAKNLKLEVDAQVDAVYADATRLEQVLVNLIDNARKFTPSGGRISVHWKSIDGAVLLEVVDTGSGISLEHQSRLFERFYRVDKARSREMGGTGLGLAIVKHIMSRHGGEISVESTLGSGTRFTARFPLPS